MEDSRLVNSLPCSQYEHDGMSNLQETIFGIENHTFSEIFGLKFFEGRCLHFAQIYHEEVHQHVLSLGIEHNCVEGEV